MKLLFLKFHLTIIHHSSHWLNVFSLKRLGRVGIGSASKPNPKSIAESYRPSPRASLGFSLFSRHLISSEKFRVLKTADRNRQLSNHWNRLSETEKSEYNIEAVKVKRRSKRLCALCNVYIHLIIFPSCINFSFI